MLSILLGAIAMGIGILRHHGKPSPLIALLIGGLIYWFKDLLGHDAEPLLVTLGAAFIIAGHVYNIKLIKSCCQS